PCKVLAHRTEEENKAFFAAIRRLKESNLSSPKSAEEAIQLIRNNQAWLAENIFGNPIPEGLNRPDIAGFVWEKALPKEVNGCAGERLEKLREIATSQLRKFDEFSNGFSKDLTETKHRRRR